MVLKNMLTLKINLKDYRKICKYPSIKYTNMNINI